MKRNFRGRLSRLLVFIGALAALTGWPSAAAAQSPSDCPEIMPTSSVSRGMTGIGYTVVSGREPTTFDVEVLGVLPNGIGPGRDMIIVKVAGPIIDQAGGIWFGMSGSPVYVGGKLIGAVAFGLTFGPSNVGGLTPAEELVRVRDYPKAPPAFALPFGSLGGFAMSKTMSKTIAAETDTSPGEVGNMAQLKVPLSASGLNGRGMKRLKSMIKQEQLPFVPYAGTSASLAAAAPAEPLERGDNFAAALSYGDVTLAGVGTTSYVCNEKALAFGHPFLFTGRSSLGANAADALAIVNDPIFGPFKLATIAEGIGRVDQDRLAAIRAFVGEQPRAAPIRSRVTSADTGRSRNGATDVVMPSLMPMVAFLHLFQSIDTTFDAIGPGSSQITWTVEGTRADGRTWGLSRSNVYASRYDISIDSSWELAAALDLIAANPFEDVRFTSVRVETTLEDAVKRYTLGDVLASTNGRTFKKARVVRAVPGQTITLRIGLNPADRSAAKTVDMTLTIPKKAKHGGAVEILGAPQGPPNVCFPGGECGGEGGEGGGATVKSFEALIRVLRGQRPNNAILARLRLGWRGRVADRESALLDQVVLGGKMIEVRLPADEEGGGEGGEAPPPPDAGGKG